MIIPHRIIIFFFRKNIVQRLFKTSARPFFKKSTSLFLQRVSQKKYYENQHLPWGKQLTYKGTKMGTSGVPSFLLKQKPPEPKPSQILWNYRRVNQLPGIIPVPYHSRYHSVPLLLPWKATSPAAEVPARSFRWWKDGREGYHRRQGRRCGDVMRCGEQEESRLWWRRLKREENSEGSKLQNDFSDCWSKTNFFLSRENRMELWTKSNKQIWGGMCWAQKTYLVDTSFS